MTTDHSTNYTEYSHGYCNTSKQGYAATKVDLLVILNLLAKSLCTAKSRGYILGDHRCPIYYKCHPHVGAEKVRGSCKSVRFFLRGTSMSVQVIIAIYSVDITIWTQPTGWYRHPSGHTTSIAKNPSKPIIQASKVWHTILSHYTRKCY